MDSHQNLELIGLMDLSHFIPRYKAPCFLHPSIVRVFHGDPVRLSRLSNSVAAVFQSCPSFNPLSESESI